MDNKIVKISIKGAILMMIGIGFINIFLVSFIARFILDENMLMIILNAVFSSAIVAYVITYIEQKNKDGKKFISRYIKFALLFGITSYLWTKGTFL